MGNTAEMSYSTKVDGTNRYGDFMANLKRTRSGGTYNISSHAGSRSCNNYYYVCDSTYVPATTRGCRQSQYYPGAGGSISTTTKAINVYPINGVNALVPPPYYGSLWANVVTSVSGGGGGSYAWQTDYDANVDPYNMGNTWGAPRRDMVGGML